MFSAGFVGLVLCPLGHSRSINAIHGIASMLYMIDHVVMLEILGQRRIYRVLFCTSFVLHCLAPGLASLLAIKMKQRNLQSPLLQAHVDEIMFRGQLFQMIFQYGIFVSFVS